MGAAVKKKLTVAAAFFGGGANSTGLLSPGKPALVADDILCTGRRDVASRLHAFFFVHTRGSAEASRFLSCYTWRYAAQLLRAAV